MKLFNALNFKFQAALVACFTFSLLFTIAAFADDVPKIGDSILGLIDAVRVGGAGVIIAAVVKVLRSDFALGLLSKVNAKFIPWITLAIAVLANVGIAIASASEKPLWLTLLEGVLMSLVSNGIFDLTKVAKKE